MQEYLVQDSVLGVAVIFLLQKGYPYVLQEQNLSAGVGLVLSGQNAQKGGLAGTIGCYESNFVSLIYIESYMFEENLRTVRLGYVLYLKK
ncbi:unknown [Bacteroides sp. CAG:1060]|nr:unknown [Bacteroides sp. CAG:1060]